MRIPGQPQLKFRTDSNAHPGRVLIVEDDTVAASILREMLVRLGYSIAGIAASGEQALSQLQQRPADILLMDVQIPGALDGIETVRRIPSDLLIPVIYLTAHTDDETIARASATRPCGFLIKPIQERLLHANIVAALASTFSRKSIWERPELTPDPAY